ncbi:hypothetical protein scyTo_0022678, partial [Scyliorhinus torazame]|nr:hypothetical protein [Scyliorhinus torazame]
PGQFPSSFVEAVSIPNTKLGEKLCVCTNDFDAASNSDLSLKRGDIVVVEDGPGGYWLRGRTNWGSSGIFPASCARELRLSSRARELSRKAVDELPEYGLGRALALMSLSAQLPEELDFTEGDIITIVGLPEPGWFQGELEGRRGIFPEGFVELMGPLQTPEAGPGCGVGSCEQEEEEEEEGVEEEEEEAAAPGVYGVAMYDFRALEPEELDFARGQRIRVTATLEDGWLQGSVGGRSGIFPIRFVKLEEEQVGRVEAPEQPPMAQSHQTTGSWWPDSSELDLSERGGLAGTAMNSDPPVIPSDPAQVTNVGQTAWQPAPPPGHGWVENSDVTVVLDLMEESGEGGGQQRSEGPKWDDDRSAESRVHTKGLVARGNLDSKCSEQIEEFNRSLPSPRSEVSPAVLRHFSISDYNTEQDVARGAPQIPARSTRPAPPRPRTFARSPCPGRSLRPSRPAPLPPPQAALPSKGEACPPRCPHPRLSRPHLHREGGRDWEGASIPRGPSPGLLRSRIQELEWDLEMHHRTRDSLKAMLERPLEE